MKKRKSNKHHRNTRIVKDGRVYDSCNAFSGAIKFVGENHPDLLGNNDARDLHNLVKEWMRATDRADKVVGGNSEYATDQNFAYVQEDFKSFREFLAQKKG